MKRFIAVTFTAFMLGDVGPTHGAYQFITAELHTTITTGSGPKSVFRVYAYFTDCDDTVFGWSGMTIDPVVIESRNAADTAPGGNFFNPGGAQSNTAPTLEQINGSKKSPAIPNIQWGTFATIGVPVADMGSGPTPEYPDQIDMTSLSPGFGNFIAGNQFSQACAVFAQVQDGFNSQGRADYLGDGDGRLRVMLMQLTVPSGDIVTLDIDLLVQLDGSGQTVTIPDQVPILTPPQFAPCNGADIAPPGGNNNVNVDDLIAVINGWGACPAKGECLADMFPICDGDGLVNVDDLLYVISRWGFCLGP